jgi:hypothetical protein
MIEIIPVHDKAFWSARVNLDGTDYVLDFAWNGRQDAWALAVRTAEGDVLVQGITIVTNRPLLRRFKSISGMPPGELSAMDPSDRIAVPGYDQLGPVAPPSPDADDARAEGSRGGVRLIYFEEADGVL